MTRVKRTDCTLYRLLAKAIKGTMGLPLCSVNILVDIGGPILVSLGPGGQGTLTLSCCLWDAVCLLPELPVGAVPFPCCAPMSAPSQKSPFQSRLSPLPLALRHFPGVHIILRLSSVYYSLHGSLTSVFLA